jgi:methylase of polypeptide subunit release factors
MAEIGAGPIREALLALAAYLAEQEYVFVTPTPATHARVLARAGGRLASDLRDVFGWSMAFAPDLLDRALLQALDDARLIDREGSALKCRVRASTLGEDLLFHSAYPTDGKDAIFFGPDSYRFASLIARELQQCPQRGNARLVDVGTGSGVGAIVAARLCPALEIAMTDINPGALRLAEINAEIAGVRAEAHTTAEIPLGLGQLDIVLANPPYIIDEAGRDYRDGGAMHGAEVSLRMARDAVPRLAPGGRFILYTGSAIVDGRDALRERLQQLSADQGCALRYAEIDPDVFGEELETAAYRDVERIALVSAVIERGGATG